ncbi:MAG: cellulase family glycosylhydrolase [Acidobacteria bacterium]|nr:cellulase family glycosylhydrolase [Acidobacteriota bacterium]
MRRKVSRAGLASALLILFAALFCAGVEVRARAQADGSSTVPAARLAHLRRGINLSHWFAQSRDYSEKHLREHTTARDVELIKSLGFDHVRFTVEPAPFFEEASPSELNQEYLKQLDAALDLLLGSGLAVVFDIHPSDEFKLKLRADDRFVAAFAEFWRSLARHLSARDPERLFLEIMNEPMVEDAYRWMGIQAKVAAAVREGAPRHTIVATGPRWSAVEELLRIEPLADRNVIYAFHLYEPHNFTHQGATWGADYWPYLKGVPYPSSPELVAPLLPAVTNETARGALRQYGEERWDAARVERMVAQASEWAQRRGVPLTCNEFGVYRAYAPKESRLRWIADVRAALERHQIGWAMWDYAGGFGVAVRDKDNGGRAVPDPDTAAALGLRAKL